jgi:ribosomal protein L37AE/L43A
MICPECKNKMRLDSRRACPVYRCKNCNFIITI